MAIKKIKTKNQPKPNPHFTPLQNKCFYKKSCRMTNLHLIQYQNIIPTFGHLCILYEKNAAIWGKNTRNL